MRLPLVALAIGTAITHSLSGADGGAPATKFIPANAPEIVYEGRTLATPEGMVRMGYPGIVIHLRFQGDSLALRLSAAKAGEYLDIAVDGSDPARTALRDGVGDYTLVANGGGAEHRVEVTRRTESWQGECDILGFALGADDRLLQPEALPARKLMFIGDSITCGEATDVRPGDPIKDNKMSNGRLSYGKALARAFHAQCHLVSCGGRGVMRDWQGISDFTTAPHFYELALPDDSKSTWDPRTYVPDAIGICLGTNDFGSGIPDQTAFVNAYIQFVEKIRRDAPQARIFLINSPITEDKPGQIPARSVLCGYLREVAHRIGNPLVTSVEISHQAGRPGNGHPTGPQHEAMAKELEPVFRQALGW